MEFSGRFIENVENWGQNQTLIESCGRTIKCWIFLQWWNSSLGHMDEAPTCSGNDLGKIICLSTTSPNLSIWVESFQPLPPFKDKITGTEENSSWRSRFVDILSKQSLAPCRNYNTRSPKIPLQSLSLQNCGVWGVVGCGVWKVGTGAGMDLGLWDSFPAGWICDWDLQGQICTRSSTLWNPGFKSVELNPRRSLQMGSLLKNLGIFQAGKGSK